MKRRVPKDRLWLYSVEGSGLPKAETRADRQLEAAATPPEVEGAWRELLRLHMPFHDGDEEARERLHGRLREIERLFAERRDSLAYYRAESFEGQPFPPLAMNADLRHVATLQVRLMEEAYDALRLHRYANAPANRGWMNLFRRWGNSPTFVAHFETMGTMVGEAFARFFDHYLSGRGPIEEEPLPHPWDEHATPRPTPEASGVSAPRRVTPKGRAPGVYLDSGIIETTARSDRAESPMTQNMPKRDSGSATASEADGAQGQGPPRGEPNE
jgi:hypothetical protein